MSHPARTIERVARITPREVRSPPNVLTSRQKEVLVGTLLGDGCLAKHGRFHRLFVKHRLAQESLVEFKREAFSDFVTMSLHRFDQRLGDHRYPCVQFVTRTSPLFSEWHGRLYDGRRKIVPADIGTVLTPLSLAVWFMDDGGCRLCRFGSPDPRFRAGGSRASGSDSRSEIWDPGDNQGQQGKMDHLHSVLQRWIVTLGDRASCAAGVAIQARTEEGTNPVETARWTLTTRVRDMTQSDLVGNSERPSEMVTRRGRPRSVLRRSAHACVGGK